MDNSGGRGAAAAMLSCHDPTDRPPRSLRRGLICDGRRSPGRHHRTPALAASTALRRPQPRFMRRPAKPCRRAAVGATGRLGLQPSHGGSPPRPAVALRQGGRRDPMDLPDRFVADCPRRRSTQRSPTPHTPGWRRPTWCGATARSSSSTTGCGTASPASVASTPSGGMIDISRSHTWHVGHAEVAQKVSARRIYLPSLRPRRPSLASRATSRLPHI